MARFADLSVDDCFRFPGSLLTCQKKSPIGPINAVCLSHPAEDMILTVPPNVEVVLVTQEEGILTHN